MSWALSFFSERLPCDTNIKVEIIPLEDDLENPTPCCWNVFGKLNKLVASIAIPLFIKTIADFVTRRSPDIASLSIAHYSRNPKVIKAILNQHRNDDIFGSSKFSLGIFNVANQIFYPERPKIQLNDNIMTCDPENTRIYRDFLQQFLSLKSIKTHYESIENIIDSTLNGLTNTIDLPEFNKLLSTTIMSKVFIGMDKSYEDITTAVCNIIPWIGEEIVTSSIPVYKNLNERFPKTRIVSDAEKDHTRKVLNKEIDDAILNVQLEDGPDSIIKEMVLQSFTKEQISSMIMTLFVAGQDNVSNSITHAILKLAQDPSLQEAIFLEDLPPMESVLIKALICESLRLMCPVVAIARRVLKDSCIAISKNEKIISKTIIRKGDAVAPLPHFAAKDPTLFKDPSKFDHMRFIKASSFLPKLEHMPFGHGVHMCPGSNLYYVIAAFTIHKLVKTYKIDTAIYGEPPLIGGFFTGIKGSVPISLKVRKSD
jgi:cytochrome P450